MGGPRVETAAEALLVRLAQRGVEFVLANAGTDFAPLIEGFCRLRSVGTAVPEMLSIAHESVAVAMAHGHWLVTGRPQTVMLHTNVGLANAVMGLINAAADEVPILAFSGRTPVTETGRVGSRDLPIHWGQEMRDQAAMVRELTKWDYELRFPEQVADLVDRALAIAASPPRGPVYLSLPREVLCAPRSEVLGPTPRQVPAASSRPDPAAIAEAAEWLARAERPLVVAQRSGGEATGMAALVRLAEAAALPVVEHWPVRISFPADHPLHAGFDPHPLVREADLIIAVDAPVPWLPGRAAPPADCRVVTLGADPLHARIPVRFWPADLVLAGDPAATLEALADAVSERLRDEQERLARRRAGIGTLNAAWRAAAAEQAQRGSGTPMSSAWVGRCLARAIGEEGVVFAELGVDPAQLGRTRPGSWFNHALSGGLGWALPAALGAQLADRDRLVVATVGDGSYLFANPVACHQVATANALPVLTIVLENGMWNAVRKSTLAVYPEGQAARADRMPLTALEPRPDHAAICTACGGWGRQVREGAALPEALAEALRVVREERRQALLQVEVLP